MISTALQSRTTSACDALRQAVQMLQQAYIESASLDARILLQEVLGVTREQLLTDTRLALSSRQYVQYIELVQSRADRRPLSQLIGRREFWSLTFKVTPDTLDPRPDSETLIESILLRQRDRLAPLRILDLGTGTGCLLLTLLHELPNARGTGVDICRKALSVAKENAASLNLTERTRFFTSRWADEVEGQFDIIISNPPYIPTADIARLAPEVAQYEPMLALDGGTDGFDCYRDIVPQLPRLLAPQGLAAFEIGIGQARELQQIVESSNLRVAGVKDDLACIARCVLVMHPTETTQTIKGNS